MKYVEVVVNVPIRRTFSKRLSAPPILPVDPIPFAADDSHDQVLSESVGSSTFQTFHYHLPVDLEDQVRPGHLVWAPFGAQEVQGFVLQRSDQAPVKTKPIARLARPEPVLNQTQLALAAWIADYYVAPLVEAIKLFLPPGIMQKQDGPSGVRAKRELLITWLGSRTDEYSVLSQLGRETQQTAALEWMIAHSPGPWDLQEVRSGDEAVTSHALRALEQKEIVRKSDERVALLLDEEDVRDRYLQMRGADRFLDVVRVLMDQEGPIWKSDLYELADVDLDRLRKLEHAGLIRMEEQVRFRDPLLGTYYPRTSPPQLTGEQKVVWQQISPVLTHDKIVSGDSKQIVTTGSDGKQSPDYIQVGEQGVKSGHDATRVSYVNGVRNVSGVRSAATTSDLPLGRHFLIHGVTGSGKTEIYLRAIGAILAKQQQAIVLVPEIALTPQTVARFAGRFPGRVTVIHSGLSAGERYDVWRRIRGGDYDIVVGPRSALFAPLPRLGLIIVDEEHEPSYKQDAEAWGSFNVFYDVRTVARKLAELTDSVLILGSATPSLESYRATQTGGLRLLEMPSRVIGHSEPAKVEPAVTNRQAEQPGATRNASTLYAEMPPVEIVDMRQELRAGNRGIFSRNLVSELHSTLDAGEQAILFLNRRGTNTFVLCRDCGDVQECPRCDVPLTYHERNSQLICHHCARHYPIPSVCPACGSRRIKYFGSGTQRIEELVNEISPRARVLRWDADTTGRKGSHADILSAFAAHDADVLVGTQMIAKGLDLPLVTLVGVIAADTGLYLPDFRAGERTFQLLTQVAGRAGRSARGGRVVVQTYTPEHYVIQAAARHDFRAFYAREMRYREEHGYPPSRRMARLVYWDKNGDKAAEAAATMARMLSQRIDNMGQDGELVDVIGPAPAFFARFRGYYRWQLIVSCPDPTAVLRPMTFPFGWRVDVDPATVL